MPGVLDENVVILKFDNSDFEKNTKQSMETLEQMKQSFKDSSSGEELTKLGKAAKNVDLSGLEAGVERLNRRFSLFGTIGTQAINNLTNYAMGSAKRILTAIPNQIIQGGWKRALNIEQAKFQIEGLGKVWDETSEGFKEGTLKIKDNVLNAVRGTAFGLDEAAKVASQFAASGMEAGDEMEKALKGISGAAAMTGSSFEDIGRIFTTVAGNGRLMGDQLLQFSGRGLNAAATLAEKMGKTEEEVREMVSKGKIDFKTFYTAMADAFGPQAAKANETYTGSLANMKAALSRIGADVESTKLENMKNIFNAMTPVIDQIHDLLGGVINRINTMSTAVSNFVVRGLNSIEFALKPFDEAITGQKKELSYLPKLMETAYQKLTKEQYKATDSMKANTKEAKVAWDIINHYTDGKYSNDIKERREQIEKMGLSYERVQRYTNALIKNGLDEETCHIKVEGAAKKASKATTDYGKATEKAADNLSHVSPMIRVVSGFYTLISAGKSAFNGLKGVLSAFGKAAKEALDPFIQAGTGRFFKFTKKLFSSAKDFESFGKALNKSQASEYFKKLSPEVQKSVGKMKNTLRNFATDSKAHLATFVKFISDLRDRLSKSGAIDQFVASFKRLKEAVNNFAGSKLGSARKELDRLFGLFKDKATLDNAVSGVENFVSKITKFINGLTDGEAHLTSFVKMFTSLEGKLTGLGALKFQFGADSSNFKSMKEGVVGAVVKAADMIQKAKVPEKMHSAAGGIQKLTNTAKNATKGFDGKAAAKGIFGFFKSLDYNKIADFGLKVTGIVAIFKTVKQLGDLTNATVGMMGSISGFFKSLSGLAGTIKNQLKFEVFRTIAMSVAMLAGSIAILALIPKDRLKPAMEGVIAIMGLLTGIVLLAQSKAFDANKMRVLGVSFAGMGAAMLSLAVTCEKLAKIPAEGLAKAGFTISGFIGMFVLAGHAAKEIQASGKSFLAMSAAINALLFAINALAMMPLETLVKGGTAIMYLMTELALAARIAGKAKPGGFLAMAMAVDLLVPAIIVMAMMPLEKALKGATVISGVMYAIAGAAYIVGQSKSNFKSMVAMSTVIATTAMSLTVLSLLDPLKLTVGAFALVSTLSTIAIATDIAAKGTKGAIALMGVITIMTAALALLIKMNPGKAVVAAAGLGILAVTLGSSLQAFSMIKPTVALKGLGIMSLVVAGIIALMAVLGGLNKATGGIAVKGIKQFGLILEAIGEAIGKFTGGFISGMSSGLPDAANNLSNFMKQIQPFLELAKEVKGDSLKGVKSLSDVLSNLSQIDFSQIQASGKLEGFGDSLQAMAKQFISFSMALSVIPDDDVKKTNTISKIIKRFTEIANEIPESDDSLIGKVKGVQSLSTFADQIADACSTLSKVLLKMEDMEIDKSDLKKISQIAKIITTLSKAAGEIPPSEGVVQGLAGNTTINEFAEYLAEFAPSFADFQATLIAMPEIDKGQLSKITEICGVIALMTAAAKQIPPSEGLQQVIKGNTTLNEFANQMVLMLPGLYAFLKAVGNMGDDVMAGATKVPLIAVAITAMGKAAEAIPSAGGFKGALKGVKSLGLFAIDLAAFMPNFVKFMGGLTNVTIGKGDVSKIQNIGTALESIAKLSNSLKSSGGLKGKLLGNKDLGGFAEGLASLAKGVKSASEKFKDVNTDSLSEKMDAVKKAVSKAKSFDKAPSAATLDKLGTNIKSFAKKVSASKTDDLVSKSSSIAKAVANLGKAAKSGVKGADLKSFSTTGQTIAKNFASGINKASHNAKQAGKSVGKDAKSGMKSGGDGSKSIGKNIGQGLVDGLNSKKDDAYRAGYAVGKAAVKGQKDGSNTNSPSKAAIKVGKGIGQGLVMGIKSYNDRVYHAGFNSGDLGVKGQFDAVKASINDISSPTITPVLDSSKIDRSIRDLNNRFTATKAMSIKPSRQNPADKIAASIAGINSPNNTTTNYFTFNVDGTENPEDFAYRVMRSLESGARVI